MLPSGVSIIKLRANMHIAAHVKTLISSNNDRKNLYWWCHVCLIVKESLNVIDVFFPFTVHWLNWLNTQPGFKKNPPKNQPPSQTSLKQSQRIMDGTWNDMQYLYFNIFIVLFLQSPSFWLHSNFKHPQTHRQMVSPVDSWKCRNKQTDWVGWPAVS